MTTIPLRANSSLKTIETKPSVAEQFETSEQQRQAGVLGMWIFLATEVLFFGGLFLAYSVYRSRYPEAFLEGSRALKEWIGTMNTAILLTSSYFMARSVEGSHAGKRSKTLSGLTLTWLLGAVFLGLKALEYFEDYRAGFIPGSHLSALAEKHEGLQLFALLYYFMTGLHAVHMIIGLSLVAWVRHGVSLGRHGNAVEIVGLYWHFVDVIWIFLWPLLYLPGVSR